MNISLSQRILLLVSLSLLSFPVSCQKAPKPSAAHAAATTKAAKDKNVTIHAELKITVHGSAVIAELALTNPSPENHLFVEKSKFPLPAGVSSDLFKIETNGQKVPYTGQMAKRGAPGPADFFDLAPGREIKGGLDLAPLYGFLPGAHEYSARYRAFYADPKDPDNLTIVESNTVTFMLQR